MRDKKNIVGIINVCTEVASIISVVSTKSMPGPSPTTPQRFENASQNPLKGLASIKVPLGKPYGAMYRVGDGKVGDVE